MVKILLTADIHLGVDIEKPPVPDSIRLKTFKKILYLAKSHDLLIIAGDLFHNNGINERLADLVSGEFNSLRESGMEIVWALGENEINENNSTFLSKINISKIFLDDGNPAYFSCVKDNQKIHIYGISPFNKHNISSITKASPDGFHIGLFHADFYLDESNKTHDSNVIDKEVLTSLNLDFYALGHNHQFKLFKSNGRYIGASPGSPEAVSFDDTGDRYVLSLIIKDNEIYQIKRLTVNSSKVECITLDCAGFTDDSRIMQVLEEKKSKDTILKIIITGQRNFKLGFDKISKYENEYMNLYIEDKSSSINDTFTNEFAGEESLRGEFFNILEGKIKNYEIPDGVDIKTLSHIISKIINSGCYALEDLCDYWNA